MAVYGKYDQEALDRQYNARAAVADTEIWFARWAEESAAVRKTAAGARLDIAYGDHPRERLDFFPAQGGGPCLVFMHGGYWRSFDKDSFSFLAPALNRAGAHVVTISYPLAPEVGLARIVASARAAFRWLRREGAALGLDPDRLFAAGHSAGGHLTAEAASTDWPALDAALPRDLVKGGCAISGLYDLEPIRLTYLNAELRLDAETARQVSPIRHVPAGAPPLVLVTGGDESDEFHRQQSEFAAAWRAQGNEAEVVDAPGRHHFSVLQLLAESDSPLFDSVRRLMGLAKA